MLSTTNDVSLYLGKAILQQQCSDVCVQHAALSGDWQLRLQLRLRMHRLPRVLMRRSSFINSAARLLGSLTSCA